MVALGDVVEVKGGGTPSKANSAFWNGDIPWVSPKDMKFWDIEDAEDKITPAAIKGSTTNLVPRSSILIVNRSGILKHTLPVGIARRPVAINQDLKALICGPRSHPEYIAHLIKAAEPIILTWVRATTADNFPIENLRLLEIPLPPLDEQRRIAAILDRAASLRRKRKRAFDLLDSLNQSIFLEMFGEADENPNSFPKCSLGELCEFRGGSQPPKSVFSYEPGPRRVRLIQIRDYKTDAYATYIPENLAKRPCSETDVMIGRYGPPLFQILKGLKGHIMSHL
jgi:type I restriction enzyme S subunit